MRVWRVAGTAHADEHLLVDVYGLTPGTDLAAVLGCTSPINAGPQFEVLQAALHHLVTWGDRRCRPRPQPCLELASADPAAIARDHLGLAIGGISTLSSMSPVAVLSGDAVAGAPGFCALFGSTVPFDEATLARLYPGATRVPRCVRGRRSSRRSTPALCWKRTPTTCAPPRCDGWNNSGCRPTAR